MVFTVSCNDSPFLADDVDPDTLITSADSLLPAISNELRVRVEGKKLTWSMGDARCSVSLAAKRQTIVDALTKPDFELKLDPHKVKCEIEREKEVTVINISLAPKLQMKDGKAVKAWLGVGEIEAPAAIKGAIWTVAQMEDTFGIFHADLIKEVNKFVGEKCPKRLTK